MLANANTLSRCSSRVGWICEVIARRAPATLAEDDDHHAHCVTLPDIEVAKPGRTISRLAVFASRGRSSQIFSV
jgi:hypothetical protein